MALHEPTRSLVLWVPDWPVAAFLRETGGDAAGGPIAVVERNLVIACSRTARAEGVRRGQRRRDAQARCPGLTIVAADAARDQRVFAPLVAGIERLAPGVQIIRPGLCALKARGPARYYGGEEEAARVLLGALAEAEVAEAAAGVADGPFTAEQAARRGPARPVCIVPPGEAGAYLAPLPVGVLDDASGGMPELSGLLGRLGVQTLGEFAAMPEERVRERFGERGVRLHDLAAGSDSRPVEPRVPPPELHREVAFEPPLELADQVAFGVRRAADDFIAGLGEVGLVCTELRVELVGDRGERSERVWLHPGSFDAASVVDRVRWQLSEDVDGLRSGVALVRVSPEAVDAASHHVAAIFGSGPDERLHHALSRVQAMLGHRGVLTATIGGGRWLTERQVLVPWGDRTVLAKERARPWPGSLPDPLPATVFADPVPIRVVATSGAVVSVDGRDRVTAAPAVLVEGGRHRELIGWSGPWPIVERSWDAQRARRAHRFQLIDSEGVAWLAVCENGSWAAEGRYD